jgi:hypothetical protein
VFVLKKFICFTFTANDYDSEATSEVQEYQHLSQKRTSVSATNLYKATAPSEEKEKQLSKSSLELKKLQKPNIEDSHPEVSLRASVESGSDDVKKVKSKEAGQKPSPVFRQSKLNSSFLKVLVILFFFSKCY